MRAKRLRADSSPSEVLVPVDPASALVLRVVDVKQAERLQTEHGLEFLESRVDPALGDQIIPGRMDVARIEADAHQIPAGDPVPDPGQLLESSSERRSLSGHGLEQEDDRRCGRDLPRDPDRFGGPVASGRDAATHVGARVRDQIADPEGLGAPKLVRQRLDRLPAQRRVRRRQVDQVRAVGDHRSQAALLPGAPE
jgi:hypothetical protein